MDAPPLLTDVLIMFSAIGSVVAGLMCGWQLRSVHLARTASAAAWENRQHDDPELANGLLEVAADPSARYPSLATISHEMPEAADVGASLLEYRNRLSMPSCEQPQGLSQSEICEVAERLIQMAERITAEVDAHGAQLTEVNNALHGDSGVPTMESVMAAVEKLVMANETMQSQLRESRDRIVEQAHQIETAESRANTDALTRIGNRRAFDQKLADWDGTTPGVLALLDIDHFKRFNDEHGHRAGDEVLRSVANILRTHLDEHCLVARYGGEEFGLIFDNHELEDVLDLIESARCAISDHTTTFEGTDFHVSCSLGVTRLLAGEPSTEWLQRADDGLYLSKDAGRDCAHCIDSFEMGKREPAFRLVRNDIPPTSAQGRADRGGDNAAGLAKAKVSQDDATSARRRAVNQAIFDRIPNCDALSESYRELLTRLGKAPVRLSVIAMTISEPELAVASSTDEHPVTRFSQLLEVTQSFCRAVDRVGYLNEQTLVVCLPGIEGGQASNRAAQLKDVTATQLQVSESALSIGIANAKTGDTFEMLVARAIEQAAEV